MFVRASQEVLVVKNQPANAGDIRSASSVPGWGRSPGGGNSYPLQYSGLENSIDCNSPQGPKSRIQLSDFHFHFQIPGSESEIPGGGKKKKKHYQEMKVQVE